MQWGDTEGAGWEGKGHSTGLSNRQQRYWGTGKERRYDVVDW